MHRVDGPGATPGNLFTEGNPATAVPATTVTADIMNALQEEICAVIEQGGGLALDKPDNTQLLQAILSLGSSAGGSGQGIGVNQLINGEFGIMQRAETAPGGVLTIPDLSTTPRYGFDRWQVQAGTSGPGKIKAERIAFTPGQTTVPGNPLWHARHTITTGTTGNSYIRQKLEDVVRYSGGQFTFSAWMKAAASLSVTMQITQHFGSGGSADVIVATSVITIGTAWGREVVTGTLPSISGKTIGADSCLILTITLGATAFTFDLADAQAESTSAPTPMQRRAISLELDLARRYYEKSFSPDVADDTAPVSLDGASIGVSALTGPAARCLMRRFQTVKRTTPTMRWIDTLNQAVGQIEHNGASTAVTGTADNGPGSTGYPTISGSYSPAETVSAHWTADAEL
jgi:hypothetical protein